MTRYLWHRATGSEVTTLLAASGAATPILHPEIRDVFELDFQDGRRLRVEAYHDRFLYTIGEPVAEEVAA